MDLDKEDLKMLADDRIIESEDDISNFEDFEEFFGFDDVDDDGEIKELFF